jgi:DNA-directed RNA polymerase alpha subunit
VDDPIQCIERLKEYRAKRAKNKSALGMQYFFDPARPEQKGVIPKFHFLKKPKVWPQKPGWGLMSLAELRLSVRATRCLEAEGITAVHHLVVRTEEELLKIRNFGEAMLREAREKLQECGLRLGMT